MFLKIFRSVILLFLFVPMPFSFSGELYRWTDEKGTIHFNDDVSNIPEPYSNRVEKIEVPGEILKKMKRE